jgi:hypothetical protein
MFAGKINFTHKPSPHYSDTHHFIIPACQYFNRGEAPNLAKRGGNDHGCYEIGVLCTQQQ